MQWSRYHRSTQTGKHTPRPRPAFRGSTLALALVASLALAAIAAPWFQIPVDNADSAGMQAHLHAIFEAGDLLYDDEYAALRMSALFAFVTEQGVVSNHWPVGASVLQAPGWLLGRVAGEHLAGATIGEHAAAWTIPTLGVRSWAILALIWLVVRIARWLQVRVEPRVATLTCVGLVLGTPLLYYAIESPLRPHLWGAAVVAVATMRWFDMIEVAGEDPSLAAKDWRRPVELACYVGLATAVRPQLAMLAALVAHERWVASAEASLLGRAKLLLVHGSASALAFAIWPAIVLRMQLWMYGGIGDYRGPVSHHVREFLLSTHHGALVWCPILVVGVLGVAIGAAQRERGALLVLALVAAQIWLDAGTREIEPYRVLGTRTWTGGTAFGPRKLLDATPLMLPGVVWLSRWIESQDAEDRTRWGLRLWVATLLALVPTTLLLLAAFVEPRVCSTILDPERLTIALGVGLDPSNWATAWSARALPVGVGLSVAAIVGLPLAILVMVDLARERPEQALRRSRMLAWLLVLGLGIAAHVWLTLLERNTEAALEREPARMDSAAASMHPWHEAAVAAIPRHTEVLRTRLGP